MAIYTSNLIKKKHRHRGIYGGKDYSIEGVIRIPSGTELTTSDVLKFVPIGENQIVREVWAYATGTTGSLAVSIGYAQMLDSAGNPVKVQRQGPSGYVPADETFTSPSSNLTAYASGAVLSTARQVAVPAIKLAGPVDLAAGVTAGQTLATDVEIHVGALIVGEVSDEELVGGYPPRTDYLLG